MGLILRLFSKGYKIQANAVGPVATASPTALFYDSDPYLYNIFRLFYNYYVVIISFIYHIII